MPPIPTYPVLKPAHTVILDGHPTPTPGNTGVNSTCVYISRVGRHWRVSVVAGDNAPQRQAYTVRVLVEGPGFPFSALAFAQLDQHAQASPDETTITSQVLGGTSYWTVEMKGYIVDHQDDLRFELDGSVSGIGFSVTVDSLPASEDSVFFGQAPTSVAAARAANCFVMAAGPLPATIWNFQVPA